MKILQAIILIIATAMTVAGGSTTQAPRRIEIQSKRFGYQPSEITLKKGEPVTLVLTTSDVTHGLNVKELGIKTEVKKEKPAEITFTPDKVGSFEGQCSHFCGFGHGSMKLKIHVME